MVVKVGTCCDEESADMTMCINNTPRFETAFKNPGFGAGQTLREKD
jgi:hypothetical protein